MFKDLKALVANKELATLFEENGGILSEIDDADVILTDEPSRNESHFHFNEKWILDSLEAKFVLNIKNYYLFPEATQEPHSDIYYKLSYDSVDLEKAIDWDPQDFKMRAEKIES